METLQKLPLIRMMMRSPAPSSNPSSNPPQPTPPPPPPPPPEPLYETTPLTSARSLRQLSTFWLGAAFFLASTAITRRAIYRRHLRTKPKFYDANTNPHEHFSPMHDALQALNLATINCVSLGMMGVGGTLWAFDISGLKEAQGALRGRLNYDTIYHEGGEVPEGIVGLLVASREMEVAEDGKNGNDGGKQ
ncbi:hypothetical protein P280DRAFT_467032 [Massarina eburnea CBS 473.64]|uniref:Altered inheritance of mitochondria protein 11 n=1 Tax=Massarina eburnea CBS 473.64 TaxID=1395130 RepID=A0A6A6S6L8_9PLEO|nr:hypothetical protein P280DRAFT_467032 [Massarina eburnea CBS 473.64]